ncbi:MAG: DUF739 family protein [Clostridiales bacterium]|nr:DUF739 family protein [Clostridiales bacterium]
MAYRDEGMAVSNDSVNIDNVSFDFSELEKKILSKYSINKFARLMAISPKRLTAILHGNSEFSQAEIIRAAALLGIGGENISAVFFTRKVQKL